MSDQQSAPESANAKRHRQQSVAATGLNETALREFEQAIARRDELGIEVHQTPAGAQLLDCGVNVPGGIAAGIALARICLAGSAHVVLASGDRDAWPGSWVQVTTDSPVRACMLSQYAGWPVQVDKFFAMGSGPMRVRRGKEEVLKVLGASDTAATKVVGTLECDQLPDDSVVALIASECGVSPSDVCLAVAPTRSIAGCVQVVARSVETCMHKLFELDFPLHAVRSAYGTAPLCPPTPDFGEGIGRTNDSILYTGHVSLWLDESDEEIERVGPKLPSSASVDFGAPFHEIFKRYKFDFYKVDPGLFSPAEVLLMNQRSGRSWRFGAFRPDILRRSFGTQNAETQNAETPTTQNQAERS